MSGTASLLDSAPLARAAFAGDGEPASRLSLIDEFLVRQRDLTAVERFSERHAAIAESHAPVQAKYYRDLIPLSTPQAGEQYAFEVDLDACSGCKACVTGCHNLNGLDDTETWRDVGMLAGGTMQLPIIQHVTSACHHCLEPACMEGCPVLAYDKDPLTGIVRHLDDQCIGCQYCVLKCPYDVPKYNKKKGIVRKCDMCHDRLAVGEAPGCVQSCPNEAIRIRIVNRAEANAFLPGAPEPDYTLPTTRYLSTKWATTWATGGSADVTPTLKSLVPADYYRVAPEHAHMPLVVMLVLTQLSVGAFAVGLALDWLAGGAALSALRPIHAAVALVWGVVALGASTLHLGRPLYAFRAVLGLRRSWLSREIVVFGLFAKLAIAYAASIALPHMGIAVDLLGTGIQRMLGAGVVAAGLLGVFCSVMIYHDTRRIFWHYRYTATKFFLSTALLGTTTTLATAVFMAAWSPALTTIDLLRGWGPAACAVVALASLLKIAFALLTFRHLRDPEHTPMKRTARLAAGPLLRPTVARLGLGFIGGVLLPLLLLAGIRGHMTDPIAIAVLTGAVFAMTLAAELLERYLFFTAVVAPKMPGGLAT